MRLSVARRAWQGWQDAAGSWQGWSACPALVAPEVADITPRGAPRPAADRLATELATTLQQGDGTATAGTALILDLEPVLAVNVAARLNQLRLANAVLLLARWPYRQAILPLDELLQTLVGQAPRLSTGDLANVAFVLDAERSRAVPHRAADDQRADNRYRLTVADLPNLTALRARGITRIVKVFSP